MIHWLATVLLVLDLLALLALVLAQRKRVAALNVLIDMQGAHISSLNRALALAVTEPELSEAVRELEEAMKADPVVTPWALFTILDKNRIERQEDHG